jgi:hypothetical protein
MKKIALCLLLIAFNSNLKAQTVLLSENFNYPAGDSLQNNGWFAHSAGATNPILVTSPGLSLAGTGYLGNGIGNAAGVNNNGSDENRPFSSYPDSGNVYISFLIRVSVPTAGFFLHTGQYFNVATPSFDSISTAFRGRTYVAPGSTPANFRLGLTFNSATVPSNVGVDLTADLDTAQTYLVVLKYHFVPGTSNDSVSLFVFGAGTNIATEPANPTLGPLAGSANDAAALQFVALRQYNGTQRITVDGIIAQTSWNMLPLPMTAPNLVNPANQATLALNGAVGTNYIFNWSPAQNPPAALTYRIQFTSAAIPNWTSPLFSSLSNSNGTDSMVSIADATLLNAIAANTAFGDTAFWVWRVLAISGTDTTISNIRNIRLRNSSNPNLQAFNLLSPPNFSIISVSGVPTQQANILWRATSAGTLPVSYQWLAIAPGGNFNSPVIALPAGNTGADTSLVLGFSAIDSILNSLGFNVGDSVYVDWTIRATAGTNSLLASQTWRLTLYRGILGNPVNDSLSAFSLITPASNTALNIEGDPTQTVNISWEASNASLNAASTNYVWMLDLPTGDFSNPVLAIPASTATTLSLPFGAIADSLNARGISTGGSFTGKWTVQAQADTLIRLANGAFNLTLNRGVMNSVIYNDVKFNLRIFPNPANDYIQVQFINSSNEAGQIEITNLAGQILMNTSIQAGQERATLAVTGLPAGLYIIKVRQANSNRVQRFVIQR